MYMQDRPFPRDPRPEGYDDPPARTPQCFHCKYELTGFAVGQTCPECGNEIRTLYGSRETPQSAKIAVWCGGFALLSVFPGGCLFGLLVLLCPILSIIGLVASLTARAEIRRNPYLYSKAGIVVARTGFWLCVPGIVVLILIPIIALYAWIAGI